MGNKVKRSICPLRPRWRRLEVSERITSELTRWLESKHPSPNSLIKKHAPTARGQRVLGCVLA
jgi:hypothetical protein